MIANNGRYFNGKAAIIPDKARIFVCFLSKAAVLFGGGVRTGSQSRPAAATAISGDAGMTGKILCAAKGFYIIIVSL